MASWNANWEPTRHRGIYTSGTACRIRVRLRDPRSGRLREANRILKDLTPEEASARRLALRDELARRLAAPPRRSVAEFGRYWLGIKKLVVDPGTHARYEDALERHVFPRIGGTALSELRGMQVQEWINLEIAAGYRVTTVKGFFRAFRTMFQDGMAELGLSCDVTRRIRFPVAEPREEVNALQPEQLQRFLGAMRDRFRGHFALAATLAPPACGSVTHRRCAGRTSTRRPVFFGSGASNCVGESVP